MQVSWARQPERLRESREIHGSAAVACDGIEVHVAVIAVVEREGERSPGVTHDLRGIEVGNPAPTARLHDGGNGRDVAAVGADADEPRLLAGRIEREPRG